MKTGRATCGKEHRPMAWGEAGTGKREGAYETVCVRRVCASAAGDILIIWNILRYKSNAKDIVYIDHPTQAGGVIFEK